MSLQHATDPQTQSAVPEIEVFADICPFTDVGLRRLVSPLLRR